MKDFKRDIDLTALSNGCVKEFDALYLAFYPKVKSFLTGMIGDEDDAEDVAQEVFIHLWNGRKSLAGVLNLNAYVYQSVKHELFAFLKKKRERNCEDVEACYDVSSGEDLNAIVYSHELELMIDRVIENMPQQRRLVFVMSRKEGLSTEEISVRLGLSKRTVETHISLALATLRKAILALLILLYC